MSVRGVALAALVIVASAMVVAQQRPQPQRPVRDQPTSRSAPGTGAIAGVVRAADTGLPIRGVDIRLSGTGLPGGARGAFTDPSGRYEFVGLPDGQYTLTASKVRYMTMTYGQTRAGEEGRLVNVAGGRRADNVDFALPTGAVIVLRVGNRFGDPATGYRVTLYQAKFNAGARGLSQIGGTAFGNTIDDRGEVRLSGLAPGDYYVSAGEIAGPTTSTPAGEREVLTFYPGTPAEADAQPITVGLGEEVVVAFNTVVSRLARISGTVVGTARPDVMQVERRTPTGSTIVDRLLGVGVDGNFSRANLAPGEYVLTAENAKEFGAVTVTLGTDDISGIVLTMKPATPIRGRLTFEGGPPVGVAQGRFVLRPAYQNGGTPYVAQYKPDWTFEIPAIGGSGVLRGELPRGWWLKAVLLDGRDVTDTVLDFTSYQGKTVEVVVTQTATTITGHVVDAAGRNVTNYVAVAFSEDQRLWTLLSRTIMSTRPDQQGRFSLRGLPPGRYLVSAVDYLETGQERDPKTLERLRAGATAVTLAEGATETVTVRLIP